MTNAGRSRRCYRCKQRKVKCGEQRPACDTCVARGEVCPGYAPTFEFRHEYDQPSLSQPHQPPRQQLRPHQTATLANSSIDITKRRKKRDLVLMHYGGGTRTFTRPSHSPDTPSTPSTAGIPNMPSSPSSRLSSTLLHLMDHRLPLEVRLDFYGLMYLDYLPARIGASSALDASTEALISWHRNFVGMERDEVKLLRSQARALTALRESLASPTQSKSAETLCAALILASIQTYVTPGHRDGIHALLKHRGPPREADLDLDFYKTCIISSQGLLWNKSLEEGTQCLLDDPAWQSQIEDALQASKPLGQKYGIARKASPLVAKFPGLLMEAQTALGTQPRPSDATLAPIVARIHAWRADVMRPEPALCDMHDAINAALGLAPRRRRLRDEPLSAEVLAYLASFCASLIVTRRVLRLLDPASADAPDPITRHAADEEIEKLRRETVEAWNMLLESNPVSLPYINATLSAIFGGVHQLDGAGTWLDITGPMLLDPDDPLNPLTSLMPVDMSNLEEVAGL